jgi:hypothetical protein
MNMGSTDSATVPQPCDLGHMPENTALSSIMNSKPSCQKQRSAPCHLLRLHDDKHSLSANSMNVSGKDENSVGDGWRMTGQMDTFGGNVILRDCKGELVAVVVRQVSGYVMLGRTPSYTGQRRHRKIVDHQLLYPWVTVTKNPLSSKYRIKREDTKVTYVSEDCGPLFGARMLRISKESSGRPCAFIRQYFENGLITESSWDVMMGPDICPSMMVCFVAIVNKDMGKHPRQF